MKKRILKTAIATFGITTAAMAQSVPSYVSTNGLLGWWPFSNNANDMSGNGHNGKVNGAILTTDRFGNANAAYSFDGVNDYIETDSILDDLSEFTISCWFNTESITSSGEFKGIIGKSVFGENHGDDSNFYLGFFPTTFNVGFENNSGDNTDLFVTKQSTLLKSWKNVAITFTKKDYYFRLYIDGKCTDSIVSNFSPNQNKLQIMFGNSLAYPFKNSVANTQFFKGTIDDIGIWKRALKPYEISELYNANICYQSVTVTDTLRINMGLQTFNPITYKNSIKIYPNPAKDEVTIDYGDYESLNGYQIKIDNSLGQEMFQTAVTQKSSSVKLNTWTGNGMYYVKIIDPQGNTIDIKKIVLE